MTESKEITKKENKSLENAKELRAVAPAVDIFENDDEIILHADMPGVLKENLSVNIDNGILSLSGIRRFEDNGVTKWTEFSDVEYTRTFSVPQSIEVERVEAQLKNGVLELHLPKSESAKPKVIEIKAA